LCKLGRQVIDGAHRVSVANGVLLQAICKEARSAGSRRVTRDAVAPSIGINPPVRNLTKEAREFIDTGLVLKHTGYIDAPVNFEWVVLTDKGVRFCEGG
jgi:hypothetical protein